MRILVAICTALLMDGAPVPSPARAAGAPVVAAGGLSVSVTNNLDDLALGQPVRYLITVRNHSHTPQRLTVRVTAPTLLRDVRAGGAERADGVLAWPVPLPANGKSTMELHGTVGQLRAKRVTRMLLTACGLPDGTGVTAACASDMDGLLVRRAGSAALPWLAAVVLAALIVPLAAVARRRLRGTPR